MHFSSGDWDTSAQGCVLGTPLNSVVLALMDTAVAMRGLCGCRGTEWVQLYLFWYGLLQNLSLDLIGSLGERLLQYTKYE